MKKYSELSSTIRVVILSGVYGVEGSQKFTDGLSRYTLRSFDSAKGSA